MKKLPFNRCPMSFDALLEHCNLEAIHYEYNLCREVHVNWYEWINTSDKVQPALRKWWNELTAEIQFNILFMHRSSLLNTIDILKERMSEMES